MSIDNVPAHDINGILSEHDISVNLVDSTSIRLVVDGVPEVLHRRQSAVVNNVMVTAWEILYQDYAGGVHQTTLCVGNNDY